MKAAIYHAFSHKEAKDHDVQEMAACAHLKPVLLLLLYPGQCSAHFLSGCYKFCLDVSWCFVIWATASPVAPKENIALKSRF
uniref:Processing of precursor 4, ribonuclease P/MRP family, (S. cerevisiae) n=1 Tax=Mus musculus TaxID=10090 RepID=A0A0U1RP33_MOUSE